MSAYSDAVIADGASHHWRLNETGGTTAVDVIGGANGTISGGVTLGVASGPGLGTGMTFDGTTGKISTAAPVVFMPPCTLEAWFRQPAPVAGDTAICSLFRPPFGAVGNQPAVQLYMNGGYVGSVVLEPGGGLVSSYANVGGLSNGAGHHVVLVFMGAATAGSLYLDGAVAPLVGSFYFSGTTGRHVDIGYTAAGSAYFTGSIDEIAIYPLALSPAQVANHFTLGLTAEVLSITGATRGSSALSFAPSVALVAPYPITAPSIGTTVLLHAPSASTTYAIETAAVESFTIMYAPSASTAYAIEMGSLESSTILYEPRVDRVVTGGRPLPGIITAVGTYVPAIDMIGSYES